MSIKLPRANFYSDRDFRDDMDDIVQRIKETLDEGISEVPPTVTVKIANTDNHMGEANIAIGGGLPGEPQVLRAIFNELGKTIVSQEALPYAMFTIVEAWDRHGGSDTPGELILIGGMAVDTRVLIKTLSVERDSSNNYRVVGESGIMSGSLDDPEFHAVISDRTLELMGVAFFEGVADAAVNIIPDIHGKPRYIDKSAYPPQNRDPKSYLN